MIGILLLSCRSLSHKYRIHNLTEDTAALREDQESLCTRTNLIKRTLLAEATLEPTGNLRLGFGSSSKMNVIGGTRNENWCIRVKATRIGSETAISQIVELVEAGQLAKAPVQKLADQISMFFVPTSSRDQLSKIYVTVSRQLYKLTQLLLH
ncbi:probable copper-transporting ATPase hma5 [Phtheirospermum japonicum]|uniref:Probable copper-transporting ATPase hma5 n=1 Tax=Phtheirospermum japonicum TaxID=374723 RepID=A0A830D3C8_9LAMI|nr:probable copper-transporting ATPase hma5 [Phtheirospermum japonicum]